MQFSMAVIVDRLSMVELKHSGLKFASDSLKSWIERTTELSDTCTHDDDTEEGRQKNMCDRFLSCSQLCTFHTTRCFRTYFKLTGIFSTVQLIVACLSTCRVSISMRS